ncbi:MAG: translation initiation factor IF-5A [Candidatus Nanoarchaeia archaeon]
METRQTSASSLKEGSYVILDNIPCIVKSIETSKTGKHGHAKCRIEAIGMVDGRKIIKIMPGHEKVDVPIIEKRSAQVLSISGDKATVMDTESYETFEMEIPEDVKGQVVEGVQVLYWIIMDKKVIKQVK